MNEKSRACGRKGAGRMLLVLGNLNPMHIERLQEAAGSPVLVFSNERAAWDMLPEAEMIVTSVGFSADAAERAGNLRLLFSTSAGVDRFPLETLAARGVRVSNSSGIHGSQMSEQIMGVIISFDRMLHVCVRNQLKKRWPQELPLGEIAGKTLLIVGAGSIGQALARKAKAFDMRVVGIKKTPEALAYFDEVAGLPALHAKLREADYVVLLTPLTPETRDLFGKAEFAAMKREAVFINYSRGGTVDEDALIAALRAGEIAGAGLDVFKTEPLPPESPLWEMENVLLTPHSAGITPDYMGRAVDKFIETLRACQSGLVPPNEVDPARRY